MEKANTDSDADSDSDADTDIKRKGSSPDYVQGLCLCASKHEVRKYFLRML